MAFFLKENLTRFQTCGGVLIYFMFLATVIFRSVQPLSVYITKPLATKMRPTRDAGLKEVEDILANKINKEEYDPHQDEEERRDIRRQYRSLQEKTLGKK